MAPRPAILYGSPHNFDAVVPNDAADLPNKSRWLIVGGAGTIKMTGNDMADGTFVTVTLPAGMWPIGVKRIWTGGTATLLFACY